MNADQLIDLDLDPAALGLATDLYQLTMMAGYEALGRGDEQAVFELFVRQLPPRRSYLVFAGLEQAIRAITRLRFSAEQILALTQLEKFRATSPHWLNQLANFRVQADIWAVPEGTVVFANEPLVRVAGRLPEVQLVETLLLASLGYATSVASKAARIVVSADGRGLFDFGTRRGHGLQASFIAARSAYLAGFDGTSQVEAARRLGIPVQGTMAHSWVQSFASEQEAFVAFAHIYPDSTLLVDTYDTAKGVERAARIEPPIAAIRIDSGDLASESRKARVILDSCNRGHVRIVASGDLDETKIAALVTAKAPIDVFGVGSELITSADAPTLSMVYKLVECEGEGKIKASLGKRTYPYPKQIDRAISGTGLLEADRVVREGEPLRGRPLLQPILIAGQLVQSLPTLSEIREHCRTELPQLPEELLKLDDATPYPVLISPHLRAEADRLARLQVDRDEATPD